MNLSLKKRHMNKCFEISGTPFQNLYVLKRKTVQDKRGFFTKLYSETELGSLLSGKQIMQINLSRSLWKGTVRGMHFQEQRFADCKIVQCIKGKVIDVAVDLRSTSPNFLKWHAEELSETNGKALLIPEGFAHGFQTLCDHCEMLYFHTAPYKPESEGGLNPLDPKLQINWPLEVTTISQRDSSFPLINSVFPRVFE